MRNLLHRQEGAMGMILVIGFMALAIPLITGALVLSGSLSRDSQVKTNILKRQYAALGIGEYVNYLVADPARWASWKTDNFDPASGNYQETVTINERSTDFTVDALSNPPGAAPSFNPPQLQANVAASPTSISAEDSVTYTITVDNPGTELEELSKIYNGLPPGFTYVPGSTEGLTTDDPTQTTLGGELTGTVEYTLLTWDVASLGLTPQTGQPVTLSFDATSGEDDGNYCNRAWIGAGGGDPSAGDTALVTIGEDIEDLCVDSQLTVTTTVDTEVVPADSGVTYLYTYTTSITNVGSDSVVLTGFRNLLPVGFTYKLSSTSGDLISQDPDTSLLTDGRWRLDWTFSTPIQAQTGVTKTLVFQAEAQVNLGNYANEGYALYEGDGIKVDKDTTLQGDLISATSKVKVKKDVTINGAIQAAGRVDIHKDAVIQSHIVSLADVNLKKNATAQGNVTTGGSLDLQQGASVVGTVLEQATGLTIVPSALLIPSTRAAGTQDINVNQSQSLNLVPGSYGKLDLKRNATLNLESGQYGFKEIDVAMDSTINLDLTNGALTVDVAGKLKLAKNVTILITSELGSASNVTFRAQKGVDLKKGGQLLGTFLALGGEENAAFSWPTAVVKVMDVFQVTTTNTSGEIGSFEVWVGVDSGLINRPIVGR